MVKIVEGDKVRPSSIRLFLKHHRYIFKEATVIAIEPLFVTIKCESALYIAKQSKNYSRVCKMTGEFDVAARFLELIPEDDDDIAPAFSSIKNALKDWS